MSITSRDTYKEYMKKVPTPIQKNVFALQKLQKNLDALKEKMMSESEAKLATLRKEIKEKIVKVVNGEGEKVETKEKLKVNGKEVAPSTKAQYKGIPCFFYRIARNLELAMPDDHADDKKLWPLLKDINIKETTSVSQDKTTKLVTKQLEFNFIETPLLKSNKAVIELTQPKLQGNEKDIEKYVSFKIVKPLEYVNLYKHFVMQNEESRIVILKHPFP